MCIGVKAILCVVRDSTDFEMAPFVHFTDPDAQRYLTDVRRIDPQDFGTRFEGWALSRLPGMPS